MAPGRASKTNRQGSLFSKSGWPVVMGSNPIPSTFGDETGQAHRDSFEARSAISDRWGACPLVSASFDGRQSCQGAATGWKPVRSRMGLRCGRRSRPARRTRGPKGRTSPRDVSQSSVLLVVPPALRAPARLTPHFVRGCAISALRAPSAMESEPDKRAGAVSKTVGSPCDWDASSPLCSSRRPRCEHPRSSPLASSGLRHLRAAALRPPL